MSLTKRAKEFYCQHIRHILQFFCSPIILLAGIYLLYLPTYRNYFPFGDDPAVFQASAGDPKLWFTQGFSHYFIVYPEWSVPLTDFMRPGVNLIIRVNQILFRQNYALYFASFYSVQILVCALVVLIARSLGSRSKWLMLASLATAINPAFIGLGLQSAVFHFDVWCGFFAILALYAILCKRYGLAVVCLTLSVFTKEASLYAPIAAAITVFLCTRRKLMAATMLLPLAMWGLVWKFVFVGSPSGIYVLPRHNLGAVVRMIIKGILVWPTGVFDEHSIRKVFIEHSILPNLGNLVIGGINLLMWPILIAIAVIILRPYLSGSKFADAADPEVASLYVWLFGALLFGVLVAPFSRFGGSIYPLEIILFAAVFHRSAQPAARKLAGSAIAFLVISFLWNAQATLRSSELTHNLSMKSLVSSIRQHQAGVIYILNSPPAFSAPSAIAKFAGTSAQVVILSQATGCPVADWPTSASIRLSQTKIEIVSTLPSCAEYEFDGVAFPVLAEAFKGTLGRGGFAAYHFPDAKVTEHGIGDPKQITAIDMGKKLEIVLTPKAGESYSILYYDWAVGQYKVVSPSPALAGLSQPVATFSSAEFSTPSF